MIKNKINIGVVTIIKQEYNAKVSLSLYKIFLKKTSPGQL